MKRRAIYPGSFDPVTNGHLDIAERALHLFDEVIIAVATNPDKDSLFSMDERVDMLKKSIRTIKGTRRLQVVPIKGLLVNFAKVQKASAIVRGLRAFSDFEFEFQLALANHKLAPDIETTFLMPKEHFVYLSSSRVKEIAKLGGDSGLFVPPYVQKRLLEKFSAQQA